MGVASDHERARAIQPDVPSAHAGAHTEISRKFETLVLSVYRE